MDNYDFQPQLDENDFKQRFPIAKRIFSLNVSTDERIFYNSINDCSRGTGISKYIIKKGLTTGEDVTRKIDNVMYYFERI